MAYITKAMQEADALVQEARGMISRAGTKGFTKTEDSQMDALDARLRSICARAAEVPNELLDEHADRLPPLRQRLAGFKLKAEMLAAPDTSKGGATFGLKQKMAGDLIADNERHITSLVRLIRMIEATIPVDEDIEG